MNRLLGFGIVAMLGTACLFGFGMGAVQANRAAETRLFELRIYHAKDGKMKDLHARFRDHTCKLFEKHGMTLVGFWSPTNETDQEKRLIYVLAYPNKAAADKSWKGFREDPAWLAARKASEVNGSLVEKVESIYMMPTDYSAMK